MSEHDQSKALVARGYDEIAERCLAWAVGSREEERARFAAVLVGACPAGATLLELGCGAGGPTTQALARHFRLTGVDISARSIALARQRIPEAEFITADMAAAHFPAWIRTWLRPGGLLVATMNGSDTPGSYEDDWLGVPMFGSGYDPRTTRRLAEGAGFAAESLTLETADEDGEPTSFWWLAARVPWRPRASRRNR